LDCVGRLNKNTIAPITHAKREFAMSLSFLFK